MCGSRSQAPHLAPGFRWRPGRRRRRMRAPGACLLSRGQDRTRLLSAVDRDLGTSSRTSKTSSTIGFVEGARGQGKKGHFVFCQLRRARPDHRGPLRRNGGPVTGSTPRAGGRRLFGPVPRRRRDPGVRGGTCWPRGGGEDPTLNRRGPAWCFQRPGLGCRHHWQAEDRDPYRIRPDPHVNVTYHGGQRTPLTNSSGNALA